MSNIQKIKNILNNKVEKKVTLGWTPDLTIRKEGESWTDSDGKTWIRKNGYNRRINKLGKISSDINSKICKECKCDLKWGNYLDDRTYKSYQMCYECYVKFKTKLKLENKNEEFEKARVLRNKKSFCKEMLEKIEDSINFLKNKSSKLEYFNEDGTIELWDDTMKENLLKNLKKDRRIYKKELITVENELGKLRDI